MDMQQSPGASQPADALSATEPPPALTGVVVGKKTAGGWKSRLSKSRLSLTGWKKSKVKDTQAEDKKDLDGKSASRPEELEEPLVVGVVGKRVAKGWKKKGLQETSESEAAPPPKTKASITSGQEVALVDVEKEQLAARKAELIKLSMKHVKTMARELGVTEAEFEEAEEEERPKLALINMIVNKKQDKEEDEPKTEEKLPQEDAAESDVPAEASKQDPQPGAMESTFQQPPEARLQSPASAAEGHAEGSNAMVLPPLGSPAAAPARTTAEEPSFDGNVSFAVSPPAEPEQVPLTTCSKSDPIQHAPTLQDLEEKALLLRRECSTLREAQEMALIAERREDAVEICRAALAGGSLASSSIKSASDDVRTLRSNSVLVAETDRLASPSAVGRTRVDGDMTDKAEALCHDMREALQRMVSRQREIQQEHTEAEDAHESVCLLMGEELQDGALELAWAEERLTLEEELAQSLSRPATAAVSPSRDVLRLDVAHEELLTERLRRDVAESRLERARLRHGSNGSRLPAAAVVPGLPSASSARAATLRAEVRELRRGLEGLEQEEATRYDDQPQFISRWEERLCVAAEALSERSARVHMGEAELRAASAEAATMAVEAASKDLNSAELRSERREVSARVLQLEASRHALEETAQPLRVQAQACAKAYEHQKRQLFSYGAALERIGVEPLPDIAQQAQMRRGGAPGVVALIHTLARTCGSPEVAFLRLDYRRTGRLSVQDFQTGLLLGLGVDYLAVTGLTAQRLFASIDGRRSGAVTVSDLAACCPEEWRSQGAPRAALAERLRAMPWAAVGGAEAAFNALATTAGAAADMPDAEQQRCLPWPRFEELVCQQLRGMPESEAHELFEELADGRSEVSQATWITAIAEPGAF